MEKLARKHRLDFLAAAEFQELEARIRGRSTEGEKAIEERLAKAKSEMGMWPKITVMSSSTITSLGLRRKFRHHRKEIASRSQLLRSKL
jgi:guanylate kinase